MKLVKCEGCGKIVRVLQDSACPTKCCGEPMKELAAGSVDAAREKHVPDVEIDGKLVRVKVGSVEHPMLDAHYIQWIWLETTNGIQEKALVPGAAPQAVFALADGEEAVTAYEYCNLHGLWKKELK